jgi:spoIIIJ-associated protein
MTEIQEKAQKFLTQTLSGLKFDVKVSTKKIEDGFLFDLTGRDVSFLLNESGEMLDALEVILFQAFGHEIERSERFICDAEGFRQTRKAELHAMAKFAAQNVRKTGKSFMFGVLNSTERRVIHMSLQVEEDLLTESVGSGRDRRLQVSLK